MTPVIILGALTLVPVAIMLFLRINATLVFLSLCLGNVLVQFAAEDATNLFKMFSARVPETSANAVNENIALILLLLPTVLTMLFMIKTVKGTGKLVLNALPAAGVGVLAALLVVPLLPGDISQQIQDQSIWTQAQAVQGTIVGASATVCLLVLWMQRPKSGGHDEKHGKHKG